MMPCLRLHDLQRFYDAPFASIYSHFTEPRICPITNILKSPVYAVLQTLVGSRFHRSKGHFRTQLTLRKIQEGRKKERKKERKKRRRKNPEQNGTPTIVSCQD